MAKLLYIKASPRAGRSHSITVADAFVKSYKQQNPADRVLAIELFKKRLPSFDGPAVQAKYAILHGSQHSQAELNAWRKVEAVIDQFKAADKYLFAVPMWNFGIPYRLKHYIDLIVQPGYTFSYSQQEGYRGLVTGRLAFIVYARGGEYSAPQVQQFDLQKKYLELVLAFIGFSDIRSIVVEPTLQAGPEEAEKRRQAAIAEAMQTAKTF